MKTKLFLVGLAIMATTAFASAQCGKGNGQGNGCKGANYVDKNKDGVCDNKTDSLKNKNAGKCDGTGKGKNFVDTNKNGVCDNKEAATSTKK